MPTTSASTLRFATRHPLDEDTRADLVALCNAQLADTFDLFSQTKQAHWNVRGLNFIAIHELFDQLADAVRGYVDLLAERAGALGGLAEGTARMAAQASRLDEYPLDLVAANDHLAALADRFATVVKTTRAAIAAADDLGDETSADLFTEVARGLEQHLWFIEAHIQE